MDNDELNKVLRENEEKDLWSKEYLCPDREHDFPKYLYVKPGQTITHYCPSCGKESKVVGKSAGIW